VACLAFICLCHAQGQQEDIPGDLRDAAVSSHPSQTLTREEEQGIGTGAGPIIGELIVGPQNNYPIDVLKSADPKYMVSRTSSALVMFGPVQHVDHMPRHS
jgi:hypothetical protein